MRLIDADSLIESLLNCPDDEEIGLKNAKEAGLKENDDTVIIDFWERCKQSFVNFANTEPTVEAVKYANWINNKDDIFDATWRCSRCKNLVYKKQYGYYKYCSNCGSKMQGVIK